MQTILGSNGQIGHELAKELYKRYSVSQSESEKNKSHGSGSCSRFNELESN